MVEKPCLFDDSKECPVAAVTEIRDLLDLGKVYCPICPIRLSIVKKLEKSS